MSNPPVGTSPEEYALTLAEQRERAIVANTVATNILDIVGQGIDFPLRFDHKQQIGTVVTSNAGERINDSIHLILATRVGERLFNPEFGSRIPELVFEPNTTVLHRLLKMYTVGALERWEKRINILAVDTIENLDDDASKIGIHITYTIRNSHMRGSYVYPFVYDGMPTKNLYTGSEARRMGTSGVLE